MHAKFFPSLRNRRATASAIDVSFRCDKRVMTVDMVIQWGSGRSALGRHGCFPFVQVSVE